MDVLKFLRNAEKIKADIENSRRKYILRERALREKKILNFENNLKEFYERVS